MYTHPANFILNLRFKMKKPCNFPVDFVYYRDKRYFELILIQSIKKSVFQQTLEDVTPPVGWM